MKLPRLNIYIIIIIIYAFVGVFNAFLANNKPILATSAEGFSSPASYDFLTDLGLPINHYFNPKMHFDWAWYPPIKYSAYDIDVSHSGFKSPGQCTQGSGHYLGTDEIGRDVAAGIVRGCYTSFRIGFFGTFFCAILGIFIGLAMAYYGNKAKVNFFSLCLYVIILGLSMFYIIFPFSNAINAIHIFVIAAICVFIIRKTSTYFHKPLVQFPLDSLLMSVIELRRALPSLVLLLVLFPLFSKPSINNVILVIALLGWTNFARHARAEALSVKERPFVTVAKMMGAGFLHIGRKHLLPNIGTTLLIIAAMNFASNILMESTLSFLGMGLPPEEVSWGSQLSVGRKNIFAWWLVFFPGLALFILVYCINKWSKKVELFKQ